mmetsp:Transcript_16486/g.46490  ORF Transcript_16486/g.46490 Transcript_16486/m.46490 type:complete len:133 (-) Transcript_16486:93-491(-)
MWLQSRTAILWSSFLFVRTMATATVDLSLLYVTCHSEEEAETIAETLVGEKLIACANVLGKGKSIYEYKGEMHKDEEHYMLLKTRKDLVPTVIARVVDLHSYDVPCVVEVPVQSGHGPFIDYVRTQTSSDLA